MLIKGITVEQIPDLPNLDPRVPNDNLYMKLGCLTCPKPLCFRAGGIGSLIPDESNSPDAARIINWVIDEVDKASLIGNKTAPKWDQPCKEEPCPQIDNVLSAIDRINESFGSNLEVA